VRLFFATDIHGSDTCWRKFLNSGKHYDADAIVLGGDMTGKALIPVVDAGDGRWYATLLENRHDLNGEDEVKEFEDAVTRRGYYPFRTTPDELRELQEDEERTGELFHKLMLGRVESWTALADERLEGSGLRCFVCPGNDDQFEVDEILARAKHVEACEGRVEDEPQLTARIEKVVSEVTAPPERTIFSFHCPPYGSGLDEAPELTEDMRLKHAGRAPVPLGSTAVRDAIEKHQPTLSLHGHIHESRGNARIGRTLCINPGSSYEQGELLGAVVDLEGGKKVKRFVLTSG
jgi:Icc-related predicted phosphoesterase